MARRFSLSAALGRLAVGSASRPVAVCAATLLVVAVAVVLTVRTPVDLSFTGVVDRSNPEVERYLQAARRFGLGGRLLVLLEGDPAELDRAFEIAVRTLGGMPEVVSVDAETTSEWLRSRALWLVDDQVFEDWLTLAEGVPSQASADRLFDALRELGPREIEGARIVEARLGEDPLDTRVGSWPFFAVEEAVTSAVARGAPGVEVSFSGFPAVSAQDQARTMGTVQRLTPIGALAVLLLFRLAERRLLGLLAVGVTLLCAVVTTLGVVGAITGSLTLMETFFGVTVFGLGIDFAIHLLARLREEQHRLGAFLPALGATASGTGRGVVSGGLTTAGAFLITAVAPDPLALHLGLAGGVGLLASLIFMLTLLPALWRFLDRNGRGITSPRSVGETGGRGPRWITWLAKSAVRHPRWHVAVAIALIAVSLAGAPRLRFETNLTKVFNREVPAVVAVERIGELFGVNGAPWVSSAQTVEEARELADRFRENAAFSRVVSIADFVASAERSALRQRRLQAARSVAEARVGLIDRLAASGRDVSSSNAVPVLPGLALPAGVTPAEALAQARSGLAAVPRALEAGPPTLEELPVALADKLVGPDGELLVLAYGGAPTFDARDARAMRHEAQRISPDATSVSALMEAVMLGDRPWLPWVAGAILLFVVTVLLLDFRQPRLAMLALVPVVTGSSITLGLFAWLGLSINAMTAIVLPLLVGLGVDDGIHMMHRFVEGRRRDRPRGAVADLEHAATRVGRSIALTTATTCASFAVLLWSDHPGLESMALVLLLGLPVCLISSVSTVPAAAVVFGVASDRRAAAGAVASRK